MEVFVDDNRVESALVGGGTVEEALRHVQSSLCDSGHMVIGLRCDGQDVTGDTMAATLREPASSFERLEVFTGTKKALVSDAMEQTSASLIETEAACQRVAGLLTEGKTVEAAETLSECLHIWQQVHEAVGKSIELLQLDPEQTAIDDQPLLELIGKPTEVLLRVKNALQARDHVLLADILQYEFPEVTSRWHAVVTKLREEAEDLDASRGL